MKQLSILLFFVLSTNINLHAQILGRKVSKSDSLALTSFWKKFKGSIDKKDLKGLETLFQFPFYCRPCLYYVRSTDSAGITVKVTRQLFRDSVFKLFYDLPTLNDNNNKEMWTDQPYCVPVNEDDHEQGYIIPYIIVPESNTQKGSQGFIYLEKIRGKYFIVNLDLPSS